MTPLLLAISFSAAPDDRWVTLPGKDTAAKRIVLVSGDEEYRSEEMLPQLAKILNKHHGFHCTVLFAIDPDDGLVQPNKSNIPGLETLKDADLMVIFTRYRKLPDDQFQHAADFVKRGGNIVGIRTATHAFNGLNKEKFAEFNSGNKETGGFGRAVLGENWVAHHGGHGKEGTRGRFAKGQEKHPILRSIIDGEIFGPSDVYRAFPPEDCTPLVLGEVTETLQPDSKAVSGKKNDPMMPIAWTRGLNKARIFTSTMGCSQDFENEAYRRLIVNGCFWAMGKEPLEKANVDYVGKYKASPYGFKKDAQWKPGKKPTEFFSD